MAYVQDSLLIPKIFILHEQQSFLTSNFSYKPSDDVVFGSGHCLLYKLISHFCWQYAQMPTSVNTWCRVSLYSAAGLSCTLPTCLCEGFISSAGYTTHMKQPTGSMQVLQMDLWCDGCLGIGFLFIYLFYQQPYLTLLRRNMHNEGFYPKISK